MAIFNNPRQTAGTATTSAPLARGFHTPVDATSGAKTMTLPTNAPIGGEISVEKVDVSANVVTISGTIRGTSSTIDLSSQYDARTFLSEGNGSWRPISDHRTQTSLDARYGKKTDGGVFNVKAYGAKGDGVTDDTAAIQNAANDACAAKGTLLVPPSTGAYMVNPAVTNASGTSVNIINLTGPCDVVISRGATVKVISSTTPFVCVFGGQTTVLDMSGLSYSGGGTIDGNSTARRAAHVVPNTTTPCVGIGRINKGSGIKVLNLRFTNFDSIWCVTMSSSGPGNMSDVEIAGCRFDNLGTLTPSDKHDFSCIYIDAIGMTVHDNHFWQGVQGATGFSTNYGVRTAIELHGSGQHCYDNTTHGIQWGGNLWMSFNCWTETDSTGSKNLVGANWHDNVFDHVAVGVNLGGATQTGVNYGLTAVSVHHNEITVDPTLWNADTGGGTYASGVLVATSTLTGSWRGISIDHNDISITPNNTAMNTFTWSASPSATPSHICVILLGVNVSILRDWSISNNTLRGSGWDGIHVNAYSFENVTIANNRIIDPRLMGAGATGFGVYLVTNGTVGGTNNMNNCRISNNQVTDDQNSTDSPYGYTGPTMSGVIFATAGSASGTQFLDNGYFCKNGATQPVIQGFTGSPAPLVRAVDHAATFSAPSGNWAAGSTITMMTQRNAAVPIATVWRQTGTAANGAGSTWVPADTVGDIRNYGGASDNATDNTTAFSNGQQAGTTLRVPSGVARVNGSGGLGIILKTSEHIRGEGMFATTVRDSSAGGLNALLYNLSTGFTSDVEVSDMTIDLAGKSLNGIVLDTGFAGRLAFRRVRFINVPASNYVFNGGFAHNLTFEDFQVVGNGQAQGTFFSATNKDVERLVFRRGQIRGIFRGINLGAASGSRVGRVDIEDVDMDFLWYLLAPAAFGSGGTVTYTATSVTDTAANFTTLTGTNNTVRALQVRRSAAFTAGTQGTIVFDSSGSFITTAGIKRGEILRTATAWAVVSKVESETCLHVEGWYDLTTYAPAQAPSSGTSYTAYQVLLGMITGTTATTLTVNHWFDLTGATVQPASGARYEALVPHPDYPIKAAQSVEDLRISNVELLRGWTDQVSINATRYQINGLRCVDGQDMGLTLEGGGKGSVTNYVGRHNGTAGIIVDSAHTDVEIVAPTLEDNTWTNNSGTIGQLHISGAPKVRVRGGQALRTGAGLSQAGLGIEGAASVGSVISDFAAHGHPAGDIWIKSDVPAGGNRILDPEVDTITYSGTTNGQFLRLQGAGAPALPASPGSTKQRTDGGAGTSSYVKESGNDATGWVGK